MFIQVLLHRHSPNVDIISFIICTHLSFTGSRRLKPVPAHMARGTTSTGRQSEIYRQTTIYTHTGDLELPVHQTCMSLDWGRKLTSEEHKKRPGQVHWIWTLDLLAVTNATLHLNSFFLYSVCVLACIYIPFSTESCHFRSLKQPDFTTKTSSFMLSNILCWIWLMLHVDLLMLHVISASSCVFKIPSSFIQLYS